MSKVYQVLDGQSERTGNDDGQMGINYLDGQSQTGNNHWAPRNKTELDNRSVQAFSRQTETNTQASLTCHVILDSLWEVQTTASSQRAPRGDMHGCCRQLAIPH